MSAQTRAIAGAWPARLRNAGVNMAWGGDAAVVETIHADILHKVLDTAVEIAEADFADIRLIDPASRRLRLAAQRGFPEEWSRFWASDAPGPGLCLLAAQRRARIVVEDIDDSALIAEMPSTQMLRCVGVHGLQSTPVIARSGALLGTFSTHVRAPLRPDSRALRLLDLLAEHAADAIELARAQIAQRESESLFRGVFENSPLGIAIVQRGGRIANANQSFCALLGYDADELGTLPAAALIHPEDRADSVAEIERMWAGADLALPLDHRYVRKSGEPIWIRTLLALVPGRDLFIVMAADITERRQADMYRARAQQLEALGQLAGGVAHDFNNLLMTISLNLEMAEMRAADGNQRGAITEAMGAVAQGASLTRRLLPFARQRELRPERVVLHDRVRDIGQLLRRSLGEQIELAVAVESERWAVEIDAGEVDSALINLAVNARDAMPGGGRLSIALDTVILAGQEAGRLDLAPGPYLRLTIADTGTGMSPEVLRRATEPFFSTKPQGHGTGLGLSSVDGFVRQSRGMLDIESEIGRGTRVILYLPRAAMDVAPVVDSRRADTPAGKGERILVIEDNAHVRRAVVERLRLLGYDIRDVDRGSRAIPILKNDDGIRLVLSDVVMPGGMDGFDIADWVRANRPALKILLVSGNTANDPRRAAHADLRVMTKPYAIADLARALRDLLDEPG